MTRAEQICAEAYERKRKAKHAYLVGWRAANPEKQRAADARFRAKHLEARRAADRDSSLKKHYGITTVERDAMLARQGGCCAVCGSDDRGTKKNWHVDHCHRTKRVRGILCHWCNVALGQAKECPRRLRKLAEYIEAHS